VQHGSARPLGGYAWPVRTDPTDNGGMFVGRRPGTAPVRHRALVQHGSPARRRIDGAVAAFVLACMVILNLMFWGPIPAAGLWVGGQVQGATGNIGLALLCAFGVILTLLFGGLALLKRIDHTWILIRRAAGHDQRTGALTPVFAVTCAIGAVCFTVWLLGIAGPGASLAPTG
jgi:hypothetical protein